MSDLWPLLALVGSTVVGWVAARRAVADASAEEIRENHRGVEVPVVLGRVLVRAAGWAAAVALVLALLAGPVVRWPVAVVVLAGTFLLAWAGGMDDRSASGERGLAGHLRSLLRGRVTTGIVKLLAGLVAAAGVALALGGSPVRVGVSTILVALSINVTNALDVRPGRALRWALLVLVLTGPVLRGGHVGLVVVASAYLGAGLAVLSLDLRERGMLGDAGSNPLGLVMGAALASVLPTIPLVLATIALAALQVAAETVTISRLIDAVPPVRWFDRLGRAG